MQVFDFTQPEEMSDAEIVAELDALRDQIEELTEFIVINHYATQERVQ